MIDYGSTAIFFKVWFFSPSTYDLEKVLCSRACFTFMRQKQVVSLHSSGPFLLRSECAAPTMSGGRPHHVCPFSIRYFYEYFLMRVQCTIFRSIGCFFKKKSKVGS